VTIIKSAKKTGRLLIVHEAMARGGVAGEILWRLTEEAPSVISSLKTTARRLGGMNVPLSGIAELVPAADFVTAAVKEMV